nr:MAG TPA: hypothetical protein [Caudoviricetes sp.]
MSELDEIFPVARIKVFTGEYKLYTNMSELDKEIKEVDVYSKEQVLKLLEPQLTIPKSIADEFDQIYEDTEEYQTNVAQMFSSMQPYFVLESYPEILHWLEDDVKNTNVVLAYLAGKALGVDLVKVVEG